MKTVIQVEISPDEIKDLIKSTIREELSREDKYITAKEAAEILNISRPTLTKLRNSGKINVLQVGGGHPRYLKSEIIKLSKSYV